MDETTKNKLLEEVSKKESLQAKLNDYNVKIGKMLLYLIPLTLVILTVTNLATGGSMFQILLFIFVIILGVYAVNSFLLMMGALSTGQAFKLRLSFERKIGRPLDSLRGFSTIQKKIGGTLNLLKIIALVSFASLGIYTVWIALSIMTTTGLGTRNELAELLSYAGLGFTLVTAGLALLVKSVKMDITDVTGLSDYYKPSNHDLFVDNFFGDIFYGSLDPIVKLKWDEFTDTLANCLKPEFISEIQAKEEKEIPVKFAIEKILYLSYLELQGVISIETVKKEIGEILNFSEDYNYERGAKIEGRYYFGVNDLHKIFRCIDRHIPAFFDAIDRLQLELIDNIKILSEDPIYMDVCAEEMVAKDGEINIILFLYNNNPNDEKYKIKIFAPGFQPEELIVDVMCEGRGDFEIPKKEIPLTHDTEQDVVEVMSTMLKNGDAIWLTLEPREKGEQTIQVFLMEPDGTVIEGKTMTVDIYTNFVYLIKRITGSSSVLGGIATPVLRTVMGSGGTPI
ncbi:MAG: hypothetical protein ACTSO9_01090 [Candidatus Helarchaeota archaeon]